MFFFQNLELKNTIQMRLASDIEDVFIISMPDFEGKIGFPRLKPRCGLVKLRRGALLFVAGAGSKFHVFGKRNSLRTCLVETFARAGANLVRDSLR